MSVLPQDDELMRSPPLRKQGEAKKWKMGKHLIFTEFPIPSFVRFRQVLFQRVFIIIFWVVFGSQNPRWRNSLKLSGKISTHDGMGNSVVWQYRSVSGNWVGLNLIWMLHPSCPATQPFLPNSYQPKLNLADSGIAKTKINPTQLPTR